MPLMYQALDFYWVTARVEGGPVTLLEAMSTGLCCVTTPVGLANEIVKDGVNGLLVPFDDVSGFVKRTLAYSGRQSKRAELGANARATILGTMDVSVTARGIRKAYDVATANFAARRGTSSGSSASPRKTSIASPLMRRIEILEQLAWAEALMLQKQRVLGIRILLETWLAHPSSSLPPRYLLRNFLPTALVKFLVRARRRQVATRA
jgi:hypothetical protein